MGENFHSYTCMTRVTSLSAEIDLHSLPGILWIVMAIISSNILFQLMALTLADGAEMSWLSMLICSCVGLRRRGWLDDCCFIDSKNYSKLRFLHLFFWIKNNLLKVILISMHVWKNKHSSGGSGAGDLYIECFHMLLFSVQYCMYIWGNQIFSMEKEYGKQMRWNHTIHILALLSEEKKINSWKSKK